MYILKGADYGIVEPSYPMLIVTTFYNTIESSIDGEGILFCPLFDIFGNVDCGYGGIRGGGVFLFGIFGLCSKRINDATVFVQLGY